MSQTNTNKILVRKARKKITDREWHRAHPEDREKKRLRMQNYRAENPEKIRLISAKYRARKREGLIRFGRINVRSISNYSSRVCGICGLRIESRYELDHIIPLARNGTHILDNLQLTHPVCNRTKHDRLQKDMQLDIMILRELVL